METKTAEFLAGALSEIYSPPASKADVAEIATGMKEFKVEMRDLIKESERSMKWFVGTTAGYLGLGLGIVGLLIKLFA